MARKGLNSEWRVKDRERFRAMIQVEKLIHKVQAFALAVLEQDEDGNITMPIAKRMTADQINATMRLLNKALPDLQAVEITPDPEAVAILPDPLSPEQWAAQHAGEPEGRSH